VVRLHGRPLGTVSLDLRRGPVSPPALHAELERVLGDRIACGPADERRVETGPTPRVSVVVPTRDRAPVLDRCLRHLMALDYPDYEIVVVDNKPNSDATRALVTRRGHEFPRLRYLREDRPGQGWARNRGLAAASSPLVVFVDDDVLVDRSWLSAIVGGFAATGGVGCVTGLILPAELDTRAQALLEEYGGFGKGFERRIFDLAEHRPRDPLFPYSAGRFGSGASMAFRTDVLRQVGGFDAALGTAPCGGEDLTAFRRVVLAGHRIVYEPRAIAYHPHPRTYRALLRQLFRYGRGLGAYMTSCLVEDPTLVAKAPAAWRHIVSAHSTRNRNRSSSYPRSLALAEFAGLALGPLTYARGRAAAARLAEVGWRT
jgi:cellulose synthase/poly-beta-1,6-N-acetylglucosamine synthase-like glycosyltransferase